MTPRSLPRVAALTRVSSKRAAAFILGGSLAAFLLLIVVIYGHGRVTDAPPWTAWLPALNACFNATSALFLIRAYRVRRTDTPAHARNMLTALGASSLFLVSYIVYHSLHGDTKFQGQGAIRPVYFFILISHLLCSAVTLPMVFSSFFFALSGRFAEHKKISRYTFPAWLYVSVTGVVVFAMLRVYS